MQLCEMSVHESSLIRYPPATGRCHSVADVEALYPYLTAVIECDTGEDWMYM